MLQPIQDSLRSRNEGICELCNTEESAYAFEVTPENPRFAHREVAVCTGCSNAMEEKNDAGHWRCLEGSIWSPEPAVQALSYRLLYQNQAQHWASDILNSAMLEEEVIHWAMSVFEVAEKHIDAFGNVLENGDTVVLTQALNVKGTSFTAAKGTIVKRIRLVQDNTEQIEGKINGQTIVILTKFVKKG